MVTRGMDHRTIYKGTDFCVQKENIMFLQNISLIRKPYFVGKEGMAESEICSKSILTCVFFSLISLQVLALLWCPSPLPSPSLVCFIKGQVPRPCKVKFHGVTCIKPGQNHWQESPFLFPGLSKLSLYFFLQ